MHNHVRPYLRTLFRTCSTSSTSSITNTSSKLTRPLSQPTFFTHPQLLDETEVTPGISRAEYIQRRQNLSKRLPARSLSIIPSNPTNYMSADVPYLYHHNTDLMYITGCTEPGSLVLAHKNEQDQVEYTLFVDAPSADRQLWDGPMCGTGDDVAAYFAVDHVTTKSELPSYIIDALPNIFSFHFDESINPSLVSFWRQFDVNTQMQLNEKRKGVPPPSAFIALLRFIKTPAEINLLRNSCQIMAQALNDAMALTKPQQDSAGVAEKYLEAIIEFGCKRRNAARLAFPSVVASGPNSTILHYMANDRVAQPGDFVMVDAGCELHGYCSDISRSWPISGQFSSAQRDLYQLLLSVQESCINRASEDSDQNLNLERLHTDVVHDITDGLRQLGFMKGHSTESAMATGEYQKYFPHATGHYLGMDVHDTHMLPKNIGFQRGMVITIEPGIYCPLDDTSVPPAFRGLGMRIEDDVVIGGGGVSPEVLSVDAVKKIDDIENLIGQGLEGVVN